MDEQSRPAPEGMYMSSLKVGPKGQIVIPKEVRAIFDIHPGDTLLLLADVNRGIAIHRYEVLKQAMDAAFSQYAAAAPPASEPTNPTDPTDPTDPTEPEQREDRPT